MPSGVIRLREVRKFKAKREEKDRPVERPSKPLKRTNRNPNPRMGALGDHEDIENPYTFDPSKPTHDPSAYAPCCDAGLHGGMVHAGPHSYEMKARSKWLKEQARLAEGR